MQSVIYLWRATCFLLLFAYFVPSAGSSMLHNFLLHAGGTIYAETKGTT